MNDGTISNNKSSQWGGGVYIGSNTKGDNYSMTMNGGNIENNSSGYGGGLLAAYNTVTVYLKGGVIENNAATKWPDIHAENDAQIIDERQ